MKFDSSFPASKKFLLTQCVTIMDGLDVCMDTDKDRYHLSCTYGWLCITI